jgi:hypothetical protein
MVVCAVMLAREAQAVCPHLHADDAAYQRSTIAFVGEVVGEGAAPANPADSVPARATLATACPVQAQWSPPAGKACVIGVITDRGARLAGDQTRTVTVDGMPAPVGADGCFSWCGDAGAHAIAYAETELRDAKPLEGGRNVDVTLRTQTRALPSARLADGERRFLRVDRHALRAHTSTDHVTWAVWELDEWKKGGIKPEVFTAELVDVEAAWKGTCPHRRILIDVGGPAACHPIFVSGRTSHVVVYANLDERGIARVEGLDPVTRGETAATLRPAGATDLACQ